MVFETQERRNLKSLYTEHQIQTQIISFLRLKGFYVIRLNSGRMSYEYKGRRKFMMLAEKGTPDVMGFKYGQVLFVEVKRPGKKATLLQEMKMRELEEYGAKCLVATCIEDLEKAGIK